MKKTAALKQNSLSPQQVRHHIRTPSIISLGWASARFENSIYKNVSFCRKENPEQTNHRCSDGGGGSSNKLPTRGRPRKKPTKRRAKSVSNQTSCSRNDPKLRHKSDRNPISARGTELNSTKAKKKSKRRKTMEFNTDLMLPGSCE